MLTLCDISIDKTNTRMQTYICMCRHIHTVTRMHMPRYRLDPHTHKLELAITTHSDNF